VETAVTSRSYPGTATPSSVCLPSCHLHR